MEDFEKKCIVENRGNKQPIECVHTPDSLSMYETDSGSRVSHLERYLLIMQMSGFQCDAWQPETKLTIVQ